MAYPRWDGYARIRRERVGVGGVSRRDETCVRCRSVGVEFSKKKITVGRCDPCLTGSEPVLPTEVDPGI